MHHSDDCVVFLSRLKRVCLGHRGEREGAPEIPYIENTYPTATKHAEQIGAPTTLISLYGGGCFV